MESSTDETIQIEKPKRSHHRRTKAQMQADSGIEIGMDMPTDTPAPTRRRSRKISGKQVGDGVEHVSKLVVMMTGQEHWQIPASEVEPWSKEAAELLNSIPGQYIEGVVKFSGFATVAFGIFQTIAPRMMVTKALNEKAAQDARIARMRAAEGSQPNPPVNLFETPKETREAFVAAP